MPTQDDGLFMTDQNRQSYPQARFPFIKIKKRLYID